MHWIRACSADDLEDGDALQLPTTPAIAVFNVEGEFLAVDDRCSHDESSLADGYVEGDVVECAWHFAKFCLRSGSVLAPPAVQPVRTYDVKVDDEGSVLVHVAD